ncbi:autotransporter domain-containing protein [Bradyrhizobium sp. 44]|uniref:hypothetical protein n=1 Tax=unclassified Bradyrhizobium TaxID=2631580 RepID=UPI001FF7381F|nr:MULTISPECIES: hypothetical protein [unclassified Bradyrhizobium]MCK1287276.1 autotransporter domain-containing protein [Bradyrhizobium sp. 44]UPJ44099.1 autotransporter domain-containing protein [Bradyrhizobium sp. 40]
MKRARIWGAFTAAAALTWILVQPATAQSGGISIYQEINDNVVQNILQNVRDHLRRQGAVPPSSGRLRFGADGSKFDSRDPFAVRGVDDPFQALAYAKATRAAPAVATGWLYSGNLIGGIDRSMTAGIVTDTSSVTGAFDVTKIGIFTGDDALTFIGTGGSSWSHQGGLLTVDTSAPSTSITVSYLRGGLSADLTSFLGWTRSTLSAPGFVPAVIEGNTLGFTGNVQYRFDFPFSVFIEPGIGMTYSEGYSENFGIKISDTTEVHAGARFGTQMKWMDYIVQPSLSVFAYQITDSSALGAVGPIIPSSAIGYRGSGKIAIVWSPSFSSYLEVHAIGQTGGPSAPIAGYNPTQTSGVQAGLRYTWN